MKKLIALLLVAVMCFSLVACGGGETPNTDDNSAQEQQTQNGNNEPEVTEPDNTEPDNTEPENTEPQYATVEITLDNWQDYFEFCEYTVFLDNAFGEFDCFYICWSLAAKDGLIVDENNSDIAIEYTYTTERKPYTVDYENKTIDFGETKDDPWVRSKVTGMYMLDGRHFGEDIGRYGTLIFENSSSSDLQGYENILVDFEVIQIAGNLCYTNQDK